MAPQSSPGGLASTLTTSRPTAWDRGRRYLSDAGGVKGVAGDFFPRSEVSSRSRDEIAVGLGGGLGEVASALAVEVAEFVGRALPREVRGAADREPAHVRGERLVRED